MYCVTKGCYNQIGLTGMDDLETGMCKECYDKSLPKRAVFEQIGKPCSKCNQEISPLNWCYLRFENKKLHREHYLCKDCCKK